MRVERESRGSNELRGGYFMEQVVLVWTIGDEEALGKDHGRNALLCATTVRLSNCPQALGLGREKTWSPFKVLERYSLLRPTSDSESAAL